MIKQGVLSMERGAPETGAARPNHTSQSTVVLRHLIPRDKNLTMSKLVRDSLLGLTALIAFCLPSSAQFQDNTSQIPSGNPANNSRSENVDFGDVDLDYFFFSLGFLAKISHLSLLY